MRENRFPWGGRFVLLLAMLTMLMTMPALALFDHDDLATGAGVTPIAENLSLTTYKNVAVNGSFTAVDPDGGSVTFRVTKNPARGEITQGEEGASSFTYTPYENKTGKDSFTYVAEDGDGNVSQPATVSVKISKQKSEVTYSDMAGHPAQKAAVTLAERGVFVGEQVGETWLFHPEDMVSREEFLAMAMDLVGAETLPVENTGFSDDDSISTWAKPYVASALQTGAIQGSGEGAQGPAFAPDRVISQTEAAVMLDRLLRVSDVAFRDLAEDGAPAWAYQSVANLEAVGVLSTGTDGALNLSDTLTRAEAAEMLLCAQEVLDFRAGQ